MCLNLLGEDSARKLHTMALYVKVNANEWICLSRLLCIFSYNDHIGPASEGKKEVFGLFKVLAK